MKGYTIKKSSWHFKLNSQFSESQMRDWRWDNYKNVTICDYFWLTVWSILKAIVVGVVLVAFASILLVFGIIVLNAFGSILLAAFGIYSDFFWYDSFSYVLFSLGIVTTVGIGLALHANDVIKTYPSWWPESWKYVEKDTPKEEKQPSFIVEAYRAHKNKYCKFVEFD